MLVVLLLHLVKLLIGYLGINWGGNILKQDVVIEEHQFIKKVLTISCIQGIAIIFLFLFIYGRYYENTSETIKFLTFIIIIEFLGIIIYYLLTKSNKQRFIFDSNRISKYKKHDLLYVIDYEEIIQIFYIRVRWVFLMQFGAGYLIIKYKKTENFENVNISMSLKDVAKISNQMKRKIVIK